MTSKDAKPKSCVRFERHVEDRLIDRRNMLLGLWAGAQLGLREKRCAIYALQIMAAGMMSRGLDMLSTGLRMISLNKAFRSRGGRFSCSSARYTASFG